MSRLRHLFLLAVTVSLLSCSRHGNPPNPPQSFTRAFWFWPGNPVDDTNLDRPLDSLYILVTTLERHSPFNILHIGDPTDHSWYFRHSFPREGVPPANEYWLVFRLDPQALPNKAARRDIAAQLTSQLNTAREMNWKVAGIQLDVDQPTNSLSQYAEFLTFIRKQLPSNVRLSITALLDWFRSGTSIAQVIDKVDEFVPQFYDVGGNNGENFAIAKRIDTNRWAPLFNRFSKPYRIGISTFGRMRVNRTLQGQRQTSLYYGRFAPLEFASNPDLSPFSERNDAGELVVQYRANRPTRISYLDLAPGDSAEFAVATPESVRDAVAAARAMMGYVAGVVFFRWSSVNDPLSISPREVLGAQADPRTLELQTSDGRCATVSCTELFLYGAEPFVYNTVRFRITSSAPLEYFIPHEKMPVRMTTANTLELVLPPFCARGRLRLGRAVSLAKADFRVEKLP